MWATTDTYLVGDDLVRIRTNTDAAGAAVRRVLGDRLVDDVDGGFLWSLRLEPPARGEQPLHVLYENSCVVRRSRDPERLLTLLLAHVEGREAAGGPGALQLAGVALVGAAGAAVVPMSYESAVAAVERRLAAAGLVLVDAPYLRFDVATGELVVSPSPVPAPGALDEVDLFRRAEPRPAPPGRHRVRGWLLEDLRAADDPVEPALPLVLNAPAVGAERARRVIERIQDGALVIPPWSPDPDDLVKALTRLAAGRR